MTTIVSFGECLKFFITTLDISMSRLAKALNVDTSLVNRWIHGKRVPPYNSTYIENISSFLTKQVHNDIQKKQLEDFINKYCKIDDLDESRDKIKKILYEAQGYSIESKKNKKTEQSSHTQNDSEHISINNEVQHSKFRANGESSNVARLSNEDKIIYGIDSIFTASIPLLESAIRHFYNKNKKIYMTYNSFNTTAISYGKLIEWRELLVKTLTSGWELIIVLRINNTIPITHQFIQFILPILQTGKVHIYYYENYDLFTTLRELFIVSGLGALSFFPTKKHAPASTCCFYLRTKAAAFAYEDYVNVVLETHTISLVSYYSKEMIFDFNYNLSQINTNFTNQYNYYYDFSMFFLTPKLYEKLISQTDLDDIVKNKSIIYFQNQLQIKYHNLYFCKYYDIHYMDSILYMIQNRHICLYTLGGIREVNVSDIDILECLHNIIAMLLKHPNYHVAFIFHSDFPKSINGNYFIKERYSVFCEFKNDYDKEPIRLIMKEPMIVRAMEDYYLNKWASIAPINKNHSESITFLKRQIENMQIQNSK